MPEEAPPRAAELPVGTVVAIEEFVYVKGVNGWITFEPNIAHDGDPAYFEADANIDSELGDGAVILRHGWGDQGPAS